MYTNFSITAKQLFHKKKFTVLKYTGVIEPYKNQLSLFTRHYVFQGRLQILLKNYGSNTKLVDKQNLINSELNCIRGIEKPNSLIYILP